ncbi:hypothetical protein F5Y18DRAFT_260971 [Xylariaceae sp. FL1019]|nr:hypothetical protein F5Y18DRAFT_260971 [Xylariaceae sp. FL1019]
MFARQDWFVPMRLSRLSSHFRPRKPANLSSRQDPSILPESLWYTASPVAPLKNYLEMTPCVLSSTHLHLFRRAWAVCLSVCLSGNVTAPITVTWPSHLVRVRSRDLATRHDPYVAVHSEGISAVPLNFHYCTVCWGEGRRTEHTRARAGTLGRFWWFGAFWSQRSHSGKGLPNMLLLHVRMHTGRPAYGLPPTQLRRCCLLDPGNVGRLHTLCPTPGTNDIQARTIPVVFGCITTHSTTIVPQ